MPAKKHVRNENAGTEAAAEAKRGETGLTGTGASTV